MGTHPIFESDFDCLTENFRYSMLRVLIVTCLLSEAALSVRSGEFNGLNDMMDDFLGLGDLSNFVQDYEDSQDSQGFGDLSKQFANIYSSKLTRPKLKEEEDLKPLRSLTYN